MPSPEDTATLTALIQGVDEAARAAEATWGIGRLPLLVDDEMRSRFERQRIRWSDALEEAWSAKMLTRDQLDAAMKASGGMQRAWVALSAAAQAAGKRPIEPDVWEVPLKDGSVAALVRTNAEAARVIADGRMMNVWTIAEIANVIDSFFPESLATAKALFPGAKVVPARSRTPSDLNDPIPF